MFLSFCRNRVASNSYPWPPLRVSCYSSSCSYFLTLFYFLPLSPSSSSSSSHYFPPRLVPALPDINNPQRSCSRSPQQNPNPAPTCARSNPSSPDQSSASRMLLLQAPDLSPWSAVNSSETFEANEPIIVCQMVPLRRGCSSASHTSRQR